MELCTCSRNINIRFFSNHLCAIKEETILFHSKHTYGILLLIGEYPSTTEFNIFNSVPSPDANHIHLFSLVYHFNWNKIKMKLSSALKFNIFFYRLFGLNCTNFHRKNFKQCSFIINAIIYAMWLLLSIATLIISLPEFKNTHNNALVSFSIDLLSFYTMFFIHAFIVLNSVKYRFEQNDIITKLCGTQNLLIAGKMKHLMNDSKIDMRSVLKFLFLLGEIIIQTYCAIETAWNMDRELLILPFAIALHMFITQIIFYVDLVIEQLEVLKLNLIEVLDKHNSEDKFIKLQIIKNCYHHIIDIDDLINKCFGWPLLFVICSRFIYLTSQGYITALRIGYKIQVDISPVCKCT